MKLADYARNEGISYKTAWRWFKSGKIPCRQMDTGTILVETKHTPNPTGAATAVYARVSSAENKSNLDSQATRLVAYCTARGYQVTKVVKEIGSGINDSRPKFLSLLADTEVTRIVVEHKDRATRFGFRYIETLLLTQQRAIEVVNMAENGTEDLLSDLTSIIYSFCARLYGQRRAKRKTEQIVKDLEQASCD